MSKIVNKAKHIDKELVNEVRAAIEHRATWMGLIVDEARKADTDIEEIVRTAIGKCGCFHGAAVLDKMKDQKSIQAFKETFLTELGQAIFEMEIATLDDEKLCIEFNYCPLVAAWQKQEFDDDRIQELCDYAMDGDRGIAKACQLDFELGKTIAKGDSICEVNFYKKSV